MPETDLLQSLRLASTPEQVFKRHNYHSQYLHPLLTIELSELFDDLSGPIHFINPIEPYGDYIGHFTKMFHTYYCRENWVSFKVIDGLYEFEAQENYFERSYWKSHPVPESIHENVRESWVSLLDEHYISTVTNYSKWRDEQRALPLDKIEHPFALGGRPIDANWAHCSDFPLETDKVVTPNRSFPDQFHYPLTEDGRRFRYIGNTEAFDWSCGIHLFYDPEEQRALQTFDWT